MAIDEIITQADLRAMAKMNAKYADGYVSPTIYRLANIGAYKHKYFKTVNACLRSFLIFNNIDKGKNAVPDGFINFSNTAGPIQMGFNVDFFDWSANAGVCPISYIDVKKGIKEKGIRYNCICRFYKTDGTGPYYAIFTAALLGTSANVVKRMSAEKIALLDDYNRELKLAQINFNAFSVYINKLKATNMNALQFAKYEAAVTQRAKFEAALLQIVKEKEIDINFKKVTKVGVLGVDDVIIIAIVATVALLAYLTPKLINSNERLKTINASYNFQQFIADQNLQIELDRKAGKLSDAQADALRAANAQAANAAQKIVTDTQKAATNESESSIFTSIQNLLLIGGGFYVVSKFIK